MSFLKNKKVDYFSKIEDLKFEQIFKENINFFIIHLSITSSFSLKIENLDVIILSDSDLFDKITKRVNPKTTEDNILTNLVNCLLVI